MADKEDVHAEAIKRYAEADTAERSNRLAQLDDLKFRAGEQWDGESQKERQADGRPCLTINKIPQFIRQITGDIRQNKPAIKVRPVEDGDVGLAEVYTGLIRSIEQQSDADTAYITAADHAATGGLGWWRVNLEYEYGDSFNQCIKIKRIINPFSVMDDPLATEIDRCDARYRFVTERIPVAEFERRYPKAKSKDDVAATTSSAPDVQEWWSEDTVRIAEYWCKKTTTRKIGLFPDGRVLALDSEEAKGLGKPLRERDAETHKIVQYIISGGEVLEGPTDWIGEYIPIVPCIGEEISVGDKVVRHGLTRFAKDAQKLFNYMRSASAEVMALQPKAPYLVTPDMIKGLEGWWNAAGKKNFPYLPYIPDPKSATARPERSEPPSQATGLMAEAALASDDMKAVTGIYDASLGARSNETSGRAIIARDRQGDTGTFVYIDNLAKAIGHTGRILIDLIPKVYDTERTIRTLGEDGSEAAYIINKVQQQGDQTIRVAEPIPGQGGSPNARPILMKDDAKYDVVVSSGPSYATKRVEAAESMMQLVQSVPGVGEIAGDLIVNALDLPGATEIAKRIKKGLPPGMVEPDPNEPPPPPPPPSPEQMKFEMEQQKMQADLQMKQADAEMKQQQAMADLEIERARLMMDQQRAMLEMQIMREKAELELEIMREKAAVQLEIEQVKAGASIHSQQAKTESDIETAGRKAAVSEELALRADQRAPKGGKPAPAARSSAAGPEQPQRDPSGDLAAIARALEGAVTMMAKAQMAPKRIVRDPKTDRVIGVETTQPQGNV